MPDLTAADEMLATIAIPTWNRSELLRRCLHQLERLQIPQGVELEIIVGDNNSTDDTPRVVEEFSGRLPVRRLFESRRGKSYAMERLIEESRGDWFFFLDDDVMVHEDWLAGYCQAIKRYPGATALGGPILPSMDEPLTRFRAFLLETYPWVFGAIRPESDTLMTRDSEPFIAGGNMAFLRDSLIEQTVEKRLGLFADIRAPGEDTAMVLRELLRGHQAWLLTAPKVNHQISRERSGIVWFWKWYVGRGRSLRRMSEQEDLVDLHGWIRTSEAAVFRVALRSRSPVRVLMELLSVAASSSGYVFVGGFRRRRRSPS